MNIISLISSISSPNDLWSILINWIQGSIGNLGWTILLLTIMVKIVLFPLDILVKLSSKKQSLVQQKCAPELAKLQKKFGNNKQALQIQTNALYKREGLNMGKSCLIMLVNLIISCTLFFSFYGSLRKVSAYNTINQYEQVQATYTNEFYQNLINYNTQDSINTNEDVDQWLESFNEAQKYVDEHNESEQDYDTSFKQFIDSNIVMAEDVTRTASQKAIEKWESVKADWLWVYNIWVADATTSPFPTYENLKSMASNGGKEYQDYVVNNINQEDYDSIFTLIASHTRKYNGYYILAIVVGLITFISQYIADLNNKLKNKKANLLAKKTDPQASGSLKIMKIVMPIIMIMFVLTSSASFGIYILASNISAMIVGEIVNLIVNRMTRKKQQEVEEILEKEANRLIKKGKLQG